MSELRRALTARLPHGLPLGLAHEAGLFLAVTVAYLMVLLGGELPAVAWLVVATPVVSGLLRSRGTEVPAGSGTALGVASLALGAAEIARTGLDAAVLGGGITLVGLLTARLLTRTTLEHDLQALLLSLILVLTGSVLNVGVNYGFLFVVFAIAAVWALTTRQLLAGAEEDQGWGAQLNPTGASADPPPAGEGESAVRTRRDVVTVPFLLATGGVALFVLATTGLVFVAFPRLGVGNLGLSSNRTGSFPSAVSLRGSPRAAVGTNDVVARVDGVPYEAFQHGLYLRGGVYDVIGEAGFAQAENPARARTETLLLADGPFQGSYWVQLNPVAGDLLFTLGRFISGRILQGGMANPSLRAGIATPNVRSELVATEVLQSTVRYEVRGSLAAPGFVPEEREQRVRFRREEARAFFLALPEGLALRLKTVVDDVEDRRPPSAADPVAVAAGLRDHLLNGYRYTLDQPSGGADEPLVDFLFTSKAGHCEYFATAYAALLRAAGIPARVVGGYQGGQWDEESGTVVFRGRNAHAWVEWWLEGAGWITDDPTPAAGAPRETLRGLDKLVERVRRFWDDSVLDFSLGDQLTSLRATQGFFAGMSFEGDPKKVVAYGVFSAAVVGSTLLLLRRRRRGRALAAEHALALGITEALARVGRPATIGDTLREAAADVDDASARTAILEVVGVYERDRFGGRPLADRELKAALLRLAAVQRLPGGAGARR